MKTKEKDCPKIVEDFKRLTEEQKKTIIEMCKQLKTKWLYKNKEYFLN
jgi:hypothetical protein